MRARTPTITSEETKNVEMVKKAVDGDVEAYGKLYAIYLDRIYRYVFYRVRDVMMAEDITEEVFIKAWDKIKSCQGKERTFSPWLYRIAHNHMIDTFYRKHRDSPLEAEDCIETDNIEQKVESAVEWQYVLSVISTLPEPQKEIILLKYIEGVDNREIEQITGKRQGAIRAIQWRALVTLRNRLNVEVRENGR